MLSCLQDVVARDYGVPYWHGATSLLDEERGVFVRAWSKATAVLICSALVETVYAPGNQPPT